MGEVPDSVISTARGLTAALGASFFTSYFAEDIIATYLTGDNEVVSDPDYDVYNACPAGCSPEPDATTNGASGALEFAGFGASASLNAASTAASVSGPLRKLVDGMATGPDATDFRKWLSKAAGRSDIYVYVKNLDHAFNGALSAALAKSVRELGDSEAVLKAGRDLVVMLGAKSGDIRLKEAGRKLLGSPTLTRVSDQKEVLFNILKTMAHGGIDPHVMARVLDNAPAGLIRKWANAADDATGVKNFTRDLSEFSTLPGFSGLMGHMAGKAEGARWGAKRGHFYEVAAASYFKANGYTITQFRQIVGNGGTKAGKTDLDIVMENGGTVYAVQAKSTAKAMSQMGDNRRWAALATNAMPNAKLIYVSPSGKVPSAAIVDKIEGMIKNVDIEVLVSWTF